VEAARLAGTAGTGSSSKGRPATSTMNSSAHHAEGGAKNEGSGGGGMVVGNLPLGVHKVTVRADGLELELGSGEYTFQST
jgi:hypothetical protein